MKKRGFTLMELLAVVFIISALAFVAVPSYRSSLRDSRVHEGKVALRKVAEANLNYTRDYPTKLVSGQLTNAATNNATGECKALLGTGTKVLPACGYMNKDNWNNLAYNIFVCNPNTGAGGGCCQSGRYASMKQKHKTSTYCAYVGRDMNILETGSL